MGASKTIELDLFSNVPTTKDWTVTTYDTNTLVYRKERLLQIAPAAPTGQK